MSIAVHLLCRRDGPCTSCSRCVRFANSYMLSFRMISDTRIECQNAYSEGEGAGVWSTGSDRGGVEPWSSGSVGLDGFLSWLRQCGSHLPPLRHQPPDVLSLAATV